MKIPFLIFNKQKNSHQDLAVFILDEGLLEIHILGTVIS